MTTYIIIGLIVVAFAAFIWWIKFRRNARPYWHRAPIDRGFDLLKTTPVLTSGGIPVYYEQGAAKVSHAAIDRGVDAVFARAMCHYPVVRSAMKPKVVVLNGERAPESGTPSFRVPIANGTPYFNTEWDMMRGQKGDVHYVLAAGQVLAVGEPYGDVIMIPSDGDENFIQTITDYELEHCILAWYDGDEFDRTKTHAAGTGHPIIPDCPGAPVGLMSRKPFDGLCLGAK